MCGLFLVVNLLALLLATPFGDAGLFTFTDSENPLNIVYFIAIILITTAGILTLARFRGGKYVKWVLTGTIWFSLFSTLYLLTLFVVDDPSAATVSFAGSLALIFALVRWQRWYLIDAAAILLGTVTTAILGISLSPPLVMVLLLGLAVYDAIAVYKTGHMLILAESILNSGLPLMMVVPKSLDYKEPKEIRIRKEAPQPGDERNAFYMGLGDFVIPGWLVVSIYGSMGAEGTPIVASAIIGILLGFVVLSALVLSGKPQAGLPFLCSGAILGYVLSSLLLLGHLAGIG
jgi:presenilin-like A22 family membrane protease